MFRRLVPCLGASVAALAASLVLAAPAVAQHPEHRGGGPTGYAHGVGVHPAYQAAYHAPYYGGYYGHGYYTGGYGPSYPQYYGSGYGPGVYANAPGAYYGAPPALYIGHTGWSSSYYPQYGDSGFAPGAYGNAPGPSYGATPGANWYGEDGRASRYPPVGENVAHINVSLPPGADLWFEGVRTNLTGSSREFTSPPIQPGRPYSYEIHARWVAGGREVEQTQNVGFRAGDRLTVNFR
jgi:uncharacterized protein (TIGR03000 family)